MIGRWMRRLLVVGTLGGASWFAIRFLRGDPVPAFESGGMVPSLLPAAPEAAAAPAVAEAEAGSPAAAGTGSAPIAAATPAPSTEAGAEAVADGSWVAAVPDEAGPTTHPVKAKLKSGIYHLPGMLNYDRTVADRWYTSAEAAEGDGLRKAKR